MGTPFTTSEPVQPLGSPAPLLKLLAGEEGEKYLLHLVDRVFLFTLAHLTPGSTLLL